MNPGRLPVRVRLVAGFSAANLIVLLIAGAFVYWRVGFALDRNLNSELTRAARTVTPLIDDTGRAADHKEADESGTVWQVLAPNADVTDQSTRLRTSERGPLVDAARLKQIGAGPTSIDIGRAFPGSASSYRLQVSRLPGAPPRYLVVGVRRDHRDEAMRELLAQLALAGLGILLVTALVGGRLARASLRPVERYRGQAAKIAAGDTGLRLDIPDGRDDEITRLGRTFNEMLASLEIAMERERLFVTEASHELRTPITLLTSRVQLALRRSRTTEEHEQILTELEVDLARLATLSDRLLDLGGINGRVQPGPCDLGAVVARTVAHRRLAISAQAGEISAKLPDLPLLVPLTELDVERILTNLLDNARTHGAPPITISVDAPSGEWVRLTVADSGAGMPPALLRTAAQRFTRAEEARSRSGSGLGLSLVEALVSSAGGELRLCQDEQHMSHGLKSQMPCDHGRGFIATVLLPVADGT